MYLCYPTREHLLAEGKKASCTAVWQKYISQLVALHKETCTVMWRIHLTREDPGLEHWLETSWIPQAARGACSTSPPLHDSYILQRETYTGAEQRETKISESLCCFLRHPVEKGMLRKGICTWWAYWTIALGPSTPTSSFLWTGPTDQEYVASCSL